MSRKKVVTAVHAIRSPHGFSLTYMQDDEIGQIKILRLHHVIRRLYREICWIILLSNRKFFTI